MKSQTVKRIASLLCLALLTCFVSTAVFAQEAGGDAAVVKKEKSAFEMIKEVATTPPYVFMVLVACSIFTFTLIPERFMFYRKSSGNAGEMVNKIKQAGSLSDALTALETAPGVAGRAPLCPPRVTATHQSKLNNSCKGSSPRS